MEVEKTFEGAFGLNKDASRRAKALWPTFKNLLGRNTGKGKKAVKKAVPKGGFETKPAESVVNKFRSFTSDEMADKARKTYSEGGTGSLFADGALGVTKRIIPKSKKPIEGAVATGKQKFDSAMTSAGKRLAGDNPDSLRGKFWSVKGKRGVGESVKPDGTTEELFKSIRTPTPLAPVQNAAKGAGPLLGSIYLADKLYPQESGLEYQNHPEMGRGYDLTPHGYNIEKEAHKNDLTNTVGLGSREMVVKGLDKQASMSKIAQLEDELEKYAAEFDLMEMEKIAMEKKLNEVSLEKEGMEKRANVAETNLVEKEAEFDELRLRTIAKERSKVAVSLANDMLNTGLVKQAEFDKMVDKLMDSDEETVNVYQNLVKQANSGEDSLESLSFLSEYKGNDKLASSPHEYAPLGLSKLGETIGEAARNLTK